MRCHDPRLSQPQKNHGVCECWTEGHKQIISRNCLVFGRGVSIPAFSVQVDVPENECPGRTSKGVESQRAWDELGNRRIWSHWELILAVRLAVLTSYLASFVASGYFL